jgi:hypothetical protein
MATITALQVIYSSLTNLNNPNLLTTLTGRTEAHLYVPRDCSAHVRSRWLFDRTTAVSPKHAGPFHLRMRLQRRRFASDAQPTCRSAGFDSQGRPHFTLSCTSPISSYPLQRAETRSRLLRGLDTCTGGLEKGWGRGGLDQVFRLAISGGNNGGFRGLRAT